jgi:predicted nucleic acid-binding protein
VAAYLPDAFVIDCSASVPWYISDEATQFCDQLGFAVHSSEVWVPSLWGLELVSAIVNAERRKRLTPQERTDVLRNAASLPLRIDRDTPTVSELGDLATTLNLTSYDAVYFDLARRRKLPLATLDAALVKAARTAKLPLITDLAVFPEH